MVVSTSRDMATVTDSWRYWHHDTWTGVWSKGNLRAVFQAFWRLLVVIC
jgi:hypothetical protein